MPKLTTRGFGGHRSHVRSSHARLRRLKEKHQELAWDKQNANAVLQFLLQETAIQQGQLQRMQQMHATAQAALEAALAHIAAPPEGNPTEDEAHAEVQTASEIADADVATRLGRNPMPGKDAHPGHGQLEQSAQLALETADEDVAVPAKFNSVQAEELAASAIAEARSVALPSAETQEADGSGASCK